LHARSLKYKETLLAVGHGNREGIVKGLQRIQYKVYNITAEPVSRHANLFKACQKEI